MFVFTFLFLEFQGLICSCFSIPTVVEVYEAETTWCKIPRPNKVIWPKTISLILFGLHALTNVINIDALHMLRLKRYTKFLLITVVRNLKFTTFWFIVKVITLFVTHYTQNLCRFRRVKFSRLKHFNRENDSKSTSFKQLMQKNSYESEIKFWW